MKRASVVTAVSCQHRDPFDRLLIAQAISEQIPLVSSDTNFDLYPVARMW